MRTITIIAVIELPDVLDIRSDEDLRQDVSEHLGTWRTHDDLGRFACDVTFASVSDGVSTAAVEAEAEGP